MLEKGVDGIVTKWQGIRAVGRKRAIKLVEAADKSIGVKGGLVAAENDLITLLEDYELRLKQYDRVMAFIEELAMQIPGFKEITIKLWIPTGALLPAGGSQSRRGS